MDTVVGIGAGLDVHKKTVVACVIDGQVTPARVVKRTFQTFLGDLQHLRDWLKELGVTHVAMESTGVYWMPVYRVLEGHATLVLGNARHMANVPGRKTDMADAEWIATLLRYGLIRANFVPPAPIRQLRQLTRFRRKLVQSRTSAELRVHKLLESANIKLGSVASEVFGVSGRLMLAALASGIADPGTLAQFAKGKLRRKLPELKRAFAPQLTPAESALLSVELGVVERLEEQLRDLETLLDQAITEYEPWIARLATLPGVHRRTALEILAETGTDMAAWPSAAIFAAWAGLCPGNRKTANKRRRARSRDGNTYLKTALTQAATSAIKVSPYLGRKHARICARGGPFVANLAVAHDLGTSIYFMMVRAENYKAPAESDPTIARQRETQRLTKRLEKLGYVVSCVERT